MAEKKRACMECKFILQDSSTDKCPACGHMKFSETIKGRTIVMDAEKSAIGKSIGANMKGEYALKVR